MKKSIFMSLLAAVSLGMATVSCSSDNTEDEQGGSGSGKMETYTISCSFDNDTRMALDADASPRQYKWEKDDQITVWDESGTKIATGTLTKGVGTKEGIFTFSSSETAKYVTFVSGGTNGSVAVNGKRITIDPVQTYASTGTDISGLPIMAQGELTEVTGKQHEYTTTLQHKMSFLKFGTITYGGSATDLTISGTSGATIDPKTGTITSKATYTNLTITAANVTSGKMIAVFPGCNFSAAVHGNNILNNPTIAANLIYPVSDRNIDATRTAVTLNDFYQWDAYAPYKNGSTAYGPGLEGWNPDNDPFGVAVNSCKGNPTRALAIDYMSEGVYYDSGIGTAATGKKSITLPNGSVTSAGVWIKKNPSHYTVPNSNVYLDGNVYVGSLKQLTASNVSIRTSGDYFFLPAAHSMGIDGTYDGSGSTGYWCNQQPYKLYFSTTLIQVEGLGGPTMPYLADWYVW